MHIYAFGSVCRGEVTRGSDVDLLAVTVGHDDRFDANVYSVYSYERLRQIWRDGSPFAWHLSLESKLVYSECGSNFLAELGAPSPYVHFVRDCRKFSSLFEAASGAIYAGTNSRVFELSTAFLAIRNFATCFSLGVTDTPDFSRHSALRLGQHSLFVPKAAYEALEKARILCTRGSGENLTDDEVSRAVNSLGLVKKWMMVLLELAEENERVQQPN